jgi:UDP-N-acetylglucosamine 1-carboxyvinyltransferase
MTKANGISIIHETVYENRFTYVEELRKLGAQIELFNPKVKNPAKFYNFNIKDDNGKYFHAAKISGPTDLHNGIVNITDLRAGATLVLASLAAYGESVLLEVEHLDRGYEQFDKRLRGLGASIKRVKEELV